MKTANYWIEKLQLKKHPTAGYFIESYRASWNIITPDHEGGVRSAKTIAYYLLESKEIGYWRRIKSDEIFHFYAGNDLLIHILNIKGELTVMKLGNTEQQQDAQLQIIIPANTWFALEVSVPDAYSLVACAVTPGFEYQDYEVPDKSVLLRAFPQHKKIIDRLGLSKIPENAA